MTVLPVRPSGLIVLTEAARASTNQLSIAVCTLIDAGHTVELVESCVPGIFRVDGGPELTVGQIKFLANVEAAG